MKEKEVEKTSARSRLKAPETPVVSRSFLSIVPIIISVFGILGTGYFFYQYSSLKENPEAIQEAEVAELVEEVGKLMLLPDEVPTVATVLDTETLPDQPFFQKAEDGDKVMVFVEARQAVLYRPSAHMIINVAPLHFEDPQAEVSMPGEVESDIVEEDVIDEEEAEIDPSVE